MSGRGQELEHDPVGDLLAPFALALANATYSGRLSRTVEDEIAHDEDAWATAQLLHTGVFGTRFLLECFRTGVVDKIVEHSHYNSAGVLASEPQAAPYPLGRFWSEGDGRPPLRHEGARARTRSRAIPRRRARRSRPRLEGVEPWDKFGQQHEVTNPVRLLFDYGEFDDDGAAFGRAYNAAADELFADPGDTDAVDQGNLLTLDVLDRVLNGDRDLDGVTDALARDLGDHHLEAIYIQEAAEHPTDLDGGRAGYLDPSDDHLIHLSRQELVDVLAAITDREEAGRAFLGDAARYQAETILVGTSTAPDFGGDFSWAHRAGSFNELLMEAGDVNRVEDFQEADEQAKMIVGFVNDVVSLAKLPPGLGIVVDHGVDALGASLAPSEDELLRDNNRAHAILENGLTAAIVQGYADNGHIDLAGAEELGLVEDDRLVPYNDARRHRPRPLRGVDEQRPRREQHHPRGDAGSESVRAGIAAALLAAATLALGGCGGDDDDEALRSLPDRGGERGPGRRAGRRLRAAASSEPRTRCTRILHPGRPGPHLRRAGPDAPLQRARGPRRGTLRRVPRATTGVLERRPGAACRREARRFARRATPAAEPRYSATWTSSTAPRSTR